MPNRRFFVFYKRPMEQLSFGENLLGLRIHLRQLLIFSIWVEWTVLNLDLRIFDCWFQNLIALKITHTLLIFKHSLFSSQLWQIYFYFLLCRHFGEYLLVIVVVSIISVDLWQSVLVFVSWNSFGVDSGVLR